MCFNDKLQAQDPSYFCEKCYLDLHFKYYREFAGNNIFLALKESSRSRISKFTHISMNSLFTVTSMCNIYLPLNLAQAV